MSTFWKIFLLILLNVIVSASVTYGVLYYWENIRKSETPYQLVTISGQEEKVLSGNSDVQLVVTDTAPGAEDGTIAPTEEVSADVPEEEPTPVIRGAEIEISIIRTPGVLSSEALRIVSNSDGVVSLEGWTLEDANGHILRFPNVQLLRKGIFIEVYSRSGHSTPYEIYWNLDEAAWQSGETAVIKDVFGQIQATYRVP